MRLTTPVLFPMIAAAAVGLVHVHRLAGGGPTSTVEPTTSELRLDAPVPPGDVDPAIDTTAEIRALARSCTAAGAESIPELRAMLEESTDPLVLRHAARALGRLGHGLDREVLHLLDDPRPPVRHAAIQALGDSGDDEALPILQETLHGDDTTGRGLAVLAIGRIGGPRAEETLDRFAAQPLTPDERACLATARRSASKRSADSVR